MHVRISTKRQNGKTYRYAQFVQSYRRSDGMPATRVVANLGALPQQAIDNLTLAVKANREGCHLVVADGLPGLSDSSKVVANLRYLDATIMLEIWRDWGLDCVLADLLSTSPRAASAVDVTTALVIQRCIAPGSKLDAQKWLPTTALPQVLALPPPSFNNTRLHRVLDELHQATPRLQERLTELYQEREGCSARRFFIDVTNTFFEGRGCPLAQQAKTKEGIANKWTIGIVLLADEQGYPWRWQVVSAKAKDHQVMGDMVDQLAKVDWLQGSPLVCDRAMGQDVSLRRLQAANIQFLTAAPVDTIESYTKALPYQRFSNIEIGGTRQTQEQDLERVLRAARDEDEMQEIDEQMFVMDLGVVDLKENRDADHEDDADQGQTVARDTWADQVREVLRASDSPAARRIQVAQELKAKLGSKKFRTQAALARKIGVTVGRLRYTLDLLRLAPSLQQRLLATPDTVISERQLRRVTARDAEADQRALLCEILASPAGKPAEQNQTLPDVERLRLVAYFNPQMFVNKRRRAKKNLVQLTAFVEQLNDDLSKVTRSRKEEPTRRKIIHQLEKYKYLSAFEVHLEPITLKTTAGGAVSSFRCQLELQEAQWRRRRRYDGFVLLLAQCDLPNSAAQLATLYRDKDIVEKDFETIKSVLKIRPIYSYTDPKVQAHVTICMLALLLNRTLNRRLKQAGLGLSPKACLEILQTCHLNRIRKNPGEPEIYSVTEPNTAQMEILDALNLGHLVDDATVAKQLNP